jgi:hypothetical protein
MRQIVTLLSTFFVLACSPAPATRGQLPLTTTPLNPSIEFLLTSAASDFRMHPPLPARFRDVRGGYAIAPDGTRQYRLCGEFLPTEESRRAEWIPFATIKTSGYEQWLGAQAASLCKRSAVIWETEDLSSSLQTRFDSAR